MRIRDWFRRFRRAERALPLGVGILAAISVGVLVFAVLRFAPARHQAEAEARVEPAVEPEAERPAATSWYTQREGESEEDYWKRRVLGERNPDRPPLEDWHVSFFVDWVPDKYDGWGPNYVPEALTVHFGRDGGPVRVRLWADDRPDEVVTVEELRALVDGDRPLPDLSNITGAEVKKESR